MRNEKHIFAIYMQVLRNGHSINRYVGYMSGKDRDDACMNFRKGEYSNKFLTARKVKPHQNDCAT